MGTNIAQVGSVVHMNTHLGTLYRTAMLMTGPCLSRVVLARHTVRFVLTMPILKLLVCKRPIIIHLVRVRWLIQKESLLASYGSTTELVLLRILHFNWNSWFVQ